MNLHIENKHWFWSTLKYSRSIYFDVIFAVNRLTHPGEKRLVQICKERCEILPKDFEENLDKLLKEKPTEKIMEVIADMVKNLKEII